MMKTLLTSFAYAIQNIRNHFFHTVLSVLGIVIGVAALVAILSLIDGMEQFAREQLARTTSVKGILVSTETSVTRNGISIPKDSVQVFDYTAYRQINSALAGSASVNLLYLHAGEVRLPNDTLRAGARQTGVVKPDTAIRIIAGRNFNAHELADGQRVTLITEALAKTLTPAMPAAQWVGDTLLLERRALRIIGIAKGKSKEDLSMFIPFTLLPAAALREQPPVLVVEANQVEDVPALKTQIEELLKNIYGERNDFEVVSNDVRVAQAVKGFQLFRVIMGLIVGISVAVGGVGVMNVLLISVTERTLEIGIRKAVGASPRAIVVQFLSEAITISLFGSLLGLVLGIAGTAAFVPIIKALTEMPFQAAYTANTLVVITVVAVVVGVVFGTYPALRASRLDPVEAIRRE